MGSTDLTACRCRCVCGGTIRLGLGHAPDLLQLQLLHRSACCSQPRLLLYVIVPHAETVPSGHAETRSAISASFNTAQAEAQEEMTARVDQSSLSCMHDFRTYDDVSINMSTSYGVHVKALIYLSLNAALHGSGTRIQPVNVLGQWTPLLLVPSILLAFAAAVI